LPPIFKNKQTFLYQGPHQMHHSKKLFKLSTLALCLAALPQAAQAAEEVQQAEVEQVTVVGKNKSLRTESQNSYTVSALRSTTGLVLSPREIPQSVSVITKKQIEDQGITDLEGALQNATGINVFKSGGRTHFMSRGYFIEQFEEDGIATQLGSPGGFGLGGPAGDRAARQARLRPGPRPRRPRLGRPERRRAGRGHRLLPPGLRLQRARQLVPRPGHGPRQRGGHRRGPLRARQLPGLQAQPQGKRAYFWDWRQLYYC